MEQVKVSDLADQTVKEAKAALKKAKLKYDEDNLDAAYNDSVDEDHIISQSIKAGKTVDKSDLNWGN